MLDYNFPPFSVGECRPIRGPGRREIGHGALAERSLKAVIPGAGQVPLHHPRRLRHPRVERLVEHGVGLRRHPVADGRRRAASPTRWPASPSAWSRRPDRFTLLTDIMGDEDHFGDMDFKVAGTGRGITGIQLDLKIDGIDEEIIKATLDQAREARREILKTMLSTPAPAAAADQQVRPASADGQDQPGEDRPADRAGRQDDQGHSGGDRRQDRHRGRRHGVHLAQRGRRRRGRQAQGRGADRGGARRQGLRGQGHVDQGLRRLHRDPARPRRPVPHQRAGRQVRRQGRGRVQGRRPDAGEGDRHRRPRPRQAVAQGAAARAEQTGGRRNASASAAAVGRVASASAGVGPPRRSGERERGPRDEE